MALRLVDLYCKAGGATKGYQRAGFHVTGVDIEPQPNYCGDEFVQADALTFPLAGFDAVHASPPCQRWMEVPFARGDDCPDLLGPTRELLIRSGLPWVIENIATAPVNGPVLCGLTFGLPVIRHRRFETSPEILLWPSSLCPQTSWGRGTAHRGCYPFAHGAWRPAWREHVMPTLWPWMTLEETHDAIPPEYTEWIGAQLITTLELAA
jgi:DNA (cytosine-5)-methyltransferase 1